VNSLSGSLRAVSNNPPGKDGVIVVDKPAGMSSAQVVAAVKRLLNAQKVGHTGTLDPFAEGVLICCVNQATRLARFLLKGNKTYEATLKLGEETDTQDATGTIVAVNRPVDFSEKTIRAVIKQFEGDIEQLPPVYSALKHRGVALYKLARRGQPVQKPPRRVHISDIQIREIKLPYIGLEVACSAGTYIRTLGADIGKSLGCGGHLHALKRIKCSGFNLAQAVTLAELKAAAAAGSAAQLMTGMAAALPDMPEHLADSLLTEKIRHGRVLSPKDLMGGLDKNVTDKWPTYIKILDARNYLMAVLECKKEGTKLDYCCVFPNSIYHF
jgi:tRNA pseudouridine55 synthase